MDNAITIAVRETQVKALLGGQKETWNYLEMFKMCMYLYGRGLGPQSKYYLNSDFNLRILRKKSEF